jgi:hypothetical protein
MEEAFTTATTISDWTPTPSSCSFFVSLSPSSSAMLMSGALELSQRYANSSNARQIVLTFVKQFIWITGILHIIFGFVTAIYMLSRRYWSGGIVFLIFAIFTVICFISWIPRIPFSVVMLQTRSVWSQHSDTDMKTDSP